MDEEEMVQKLKALGNVDEDTTPSFQYRSFVIWSKIGVLGLVLASLIMNVEFSATPGTIGTHARTVITTLLGVRVWKFVEDFAELGVKAQMIAPPQEEGVQYSYGETQDEETEAEGEE